MGVGRAPPRLRQPHGSAQRGDIAARDILARFDALADQNQSAFDRWQAEGMDLDLDGAPLPAGMSPEGFLYPLVFGPPTDCLLEDVGADAT